MRRASGSRSQSRNIPIQRKQGTRGGGEEYQPAGADGPRTLKSEMSKFWSHVSSVSHPLKDKSKAKTPGVSRGKPAGTMAAVRRQQNPTSSKLGA